MLHDFLITEHYAVIPDLPVEFDPQLGIQNNHFVYRYNEEAVTRYGFLDRYSNNESKIQWIAVPTHYVFHYANAWEETNEGGETIIVAYGCKFEKFDIELDPFLEDSSVKAGTDYPGIFTKFIFNLTTGQAKEAILIPDISTEFCLVNQAFVGYKCRYVYMLIEDESKYTNEQGSKENKFGTGFLKYDLQEEKIVKIVDFGPTHSGGEVFF